jgi:hypothetical protein
LTVIGSAVAKWFRIVPSTLAVSGMAATALLAVGCGATVIPDAPSAPGATSTVAPTTAAPSPKAPYTDACQAVSLATRGEWSQSALHWDSASVAASTAGDFAAAEAFGAVLAMDAEKISLDQLSDPSATTGDIATYQSDVAGHADLLGGC